MIFPNYFDSKKSLNLYGLTKDFNLLKNLYIKNKLPIPIVELNDW